MTKALKTTDYPTKNSLNNLVAVVDNDLNRVFSRLLDRDCSQNTRLAMGSDLRSFFKWYSSANGEQFSFQRVTARDIRDYKAAMQQADLSVATVNRRLVTLNQFFIAAMHEGMIKKNPAADVKQLSKQPLAPKGLTQQDARKLLKEVEVRGNLRDRCIIELMVGAGLRVSEVVALRPPDIYRGDRRGHATIHNSKGNKTRNVPLNKELRAILKEFEATGKQGNTQLFVGQRGALTPLAVNKIVEKYAKKAGVQASPHTLRHTFAYAFLKAHPSEIVALSQILGHSNINTTAIYTQNRLEDLQEKVEAIGF
ncbi:tyrosine-type recombinase/integrase [Candidatus Peribacteria bacterium]|nr:tyrosine-type recombinase/integrase [Candidatus Peribacteria bacterium]